MSSHRPDDPAVGVWMVADTYMLFEVHGGLKRYRRYWPEGGIWDWTWHKPEQAIQIWRTS